MKYIIYENSKKLFETDSIKLNINHIIFNKEKFFVTGISYDADNQVYIIETFKRKNIKQYEK